MTRRRRLSSFVALLALMVGFVVVTAGPAAAASEADYVGLGDHLTIWGRVGDAGSWQRYTAGEMLVAIDGGETVVAYCIDLQTSISTGDNLPEVPWATSGIANLDKVSYVLNTYEPGSGLLVGTGAEKAAAIQAAIWHLTDDFNLRTDGGDSANVVANFNAVLVSIPDEGLPVEPVPSLAITPATATAYVGEVAGPFTVATTGSGLPLSVPDGVQVVDWVTREPMTAISDGDVFGIVSGSVGSVEVSASATTTIHAGRVFARLDANGGPEVQRLILAEQSEATTSASVTATFGEQPTTTTTVQETTTTTVQETTTTTAAAAVQGVVIERETLPRTGADSGWLLWFGATVTLIGVLAVAARRRWEAAHDAS